jgi:glycosyltransferase involved in cell wall biosynthesis
MPVLAAVVHSVNASVFFIRPSYSKQASSPTKQGELMAMNVPVFCNTGVGDTDVLIERYNSGILIPEFSPEAYRSAIRQWQSTRGSSSAHLRQGAMLAFALRIGIERYNQVYLRVLNK